MQTFIDLTTQHPILRSLAAYISTVDLFHLALSCRANFSAILSSRQVFEVLSRDCLCDGRGLAKRQNFVGLYKNRNRYVWGSQRKIWEDEPVEVQLWGTKCDEANALPCRKCGVNVCEECRYYPREAPDPSYPLRRPHLNSPWQNENVMCLCLECDPKWEAQEVRGKFLNELCDCDIYTRWICHRCKVQEDEFTRNHYYNHTAGESRAGQRPNAWKLYQEGNSKIMTDHQFDIMHFCPCGADVPEDTVPRCTWCKRRHLPESEWDREWEAIGSHMPFFDDDPCYPPYVGSRYADCSEVPYAPTGYDGPIWVVPGQLEDEDKVSERWYEYLHRQWGSWFATHPQH